MGGTGVAVGRHCCGVGRQWCGRGGSGGGSVAQWLGPLP